MRLFKTCKCKRVKIDYVSKLSLKFYLLSIIFNYVGVLMRRSVVLFLVLTQLVAWIWDNKYLWTTNPKRCHLDFRFPIFHLSSGLCKNRCFTESEESVIQHELPIIYFLNYGHGGQMVVRDLLGDLRCWCSDNNKTLMNAHWFLTN